MPRRVGRLSRLVAVVARRRRRLAVIPRVAERLAALIDGRLDAARRAATIDWLARAAPARETLADAAAAVGELERAARAPTAHPLRPRA